MATLEKLTEADIKRVTNSSSLKKARGYIPRIQNARRNGRVLRAEIRGSQLYAVEVFVAEDGIHALCSCYSRWGGLCKHIAALMYKWLESPGSFTVERTTDITGTQSAGIEIFEVTAPATAVPETKPRWLTHSAAQRQQESLSNLHTWLGENRVSDLREMARQQGWSISGTRKDDIIRQIVNQVTHPGVALKSMLGFDEEHLRVYQAMSILYPGIPFTEDRIQALAEQWGPLSKHKNLKTYTSHFRDVGMAVLEPYQGKVIIPAAIMRVLPPSLTDRVPTMDLPAHLESGIKLGQARPLLQKVQQTLLLLEQISLPLHPPMPRPYLQKFYDFLQDWDYLPEEIMQAQKSGSLSPRQAGLTFTVPPPLPLLSKGDFARLAPIFEDETQLTFIYHLLLKAGLLQPGSPITVWQEVKKQFLYWDVAAQWAVLARAYFSLNTWSELWQMVAERPSLQVKRAAFQYYPPRKPQDMYELLAVFRAQLLQLLACLPDDRWFSLNDVARILHPIWPRFDAASWIGLQYGRDPQPYWYLDENGRALSPATNAADWHIAQAAFLRHMVTGPLHWLGIADLVFEYNKPVGFRLHGLHDLYFEKAESVALPGMSGEFAATDASPASPAADASPSAPVDAVIIDVMTISVNPTAVRPQTHDYLDKIARLEEADATRFVYRLDAAAVHQAFESGHTVTQMLDDWQRLLPLPMPETIRNQLTAWWQAYGQVRLYENMTIIEFGDAYALTEMKAITSLEKHLIAEISPNLVVIPVQAIETLVGELEKAGYTPKQTKGLES